MRTDHTSSASAIGTRLRAQVQRARQLLREQSPPLRWGLGLVVLALLGAVVYLALPEASGTAFVRGGQKFAPDELLKVAPELQLKHIKYQLDEGRIEVEADQLDEANQLLVKLGVGERSLADIVKGDPDRPFEDPRNKERRRLSDRNEFLASLIRRVPDSGIVAAQVEVQRGSTRSGFRPAVPPSACVYLQTEQNRPISSQTVQKIEDVIVSYERDIKPDAVTVFDQTLRLYIDARDPKVGEETRRHAREEELVAKVLKEIDYIKGVRVTVQLVPASAAPAALPVPAPEASSPAPRSAPDALLPPTVAVNQPAEIVRDVEPPPRPKSPPPSTPLPVPAQPEAAPSGTARAPDSIAKVWVRVPRSWYLRSHPSNREPSEEDLKRAVARTEQQIRRAVALVVPPHEASVPEIDTIFDELPARPTLVVPETRDTRPLWLLIGATAGGVATLLVVGVRLAATRRPSPKLAPQAERGRFHVGDAPGTGAGPGPSERVRELIRLNPEAAASVLHRWTGQGGSVE